MLLKGNPNQAPPIVGVTDQNVNRPYAALSPALRNIGQVQSRGTLDYHGLLFKFQRRFADNFSVLNSYTWNKAIDLNSDNDGDVTLTNVYDPQYNRGPADYDVTHTLSSSVDLRAAVRARTHWFGGWQTSGILYLRAGPAAHHHPDPGRAVDRHRQPAEPPGRRRPRRSRRSITGSTPAAFASPTDITGTYGDSGRGILRGPGQFNIDFSIIKSTKIGRIDTEFRVEAFNLLNHPQFAQPNSTFGNAAFGTISAMLANPSCSLCGTTERNIQVAFKVRF